MLRRANRAECFQRGAANVGSKSCRYRAGRRFPQCQRVLGVPCACETQNDSHQSQSHSKKQIYLAEYCVKIAVCDCVVMRKQKPIFCLIGTT